MDVGLIQRLRAAHMAQQHTGIRRGDLAIVIEVILQNVRFLVTIDGHIPIQGIGSIGNECTGIQGLREDRSIKGISQVLVRRHVVNLKAELICAGSGVVVAKFTLGAALHRIAAAQIAFRGGGLHQIHKACTLGSGRILQLALHHRVGSAHHEICRHLAQLSFLIVVVLPQILHQHSHGAGYLRSGHGGTAHFAVVGAGQGRISRGVDAAAHTCNLRLQLQVRGDAPGGEGADGLLQLHMDQVTFAHGHGTGGHLLQVLAVRHGDGNTRNVVAAVIDLHQNLARHVVVNHAGNGASRLGSSLLLREGRLSAGDQRDLAGHVQIGIIRSLANAGHSHKLQGLALKIIEEFRGRAGRRIIVADLPAVHSEIQQIRAVIVHGGHGNRRLIRTGGTSQADIRVSGLGHVEAGEVHVGVIGIVTGCNQDLNVGIHELLQDLVHAIGRGGKAGSCTQRQVHRVHIQPDAVFQSRHNRVPTGAAVVAEHLHHHELGIGSNANHRVGIRLVGSRNTGNVGAMVMLRRGMGYIEAHGKVVENKGELAVIIGHVA